MGAVFVVLMVVHQVVLVALVGLLVESGGFHVVGHVQMGEVFDFSLRRDHAVVRTGRFLRRIVDWFIRI